MGVAVCIQHHNPKVLQMARNAAFAAGNATGETDAVLRTVPAGCCTQVPVLDD